MHGHLKKKIDNHKLKNTIESDPPQSVVWNLRQINKVKKLDNWMKMKTKSSGLVSKWGGNPLYIQEIWIVDHRRDLL